MGQIAGEHLIFCLGGAKKSGFHEGGKLKIIAILYSRKCHKHRHCFCPACPFFRRKFPTFLAHCAQWWIDSPLLSLFLGTKSDCWPVQKLRSAQNSVGKKKDYLERQISHQSESSSVKYWSQSWECIFSPPSLFSAKAAAASTAGREPNKSWFSIWTNWMGWLFFLLFRWKVKVDKRKPEICLTHSCSLWEAISSIFIL